MKTIKNLLENAPKSKWAEEAKWRGENKEWLDINFSIAIKLLQYIRLNNNDKETVKTLLGINSDDIFKGKYKYTEQEIKRVNELLNLS